MAKGRDTDGLAISFEFYWIQKKLIPDLLVSCEQNNNLYFSILVDKHNFTMWL